MMHVANPDPGPVPAVVFDGVTVVLGGVHILDGVSASVPAGGCTAIVGPNGAGKTTLLLALLGEIRHAGQIRFPAAVAGAVPRLGYVPQRLAFDRGLPMTVEEFMVMGRQRLPLWFGCRTAHRRRARELLAAVHAEGLAGRKLGALSGGELQRVLLALALQQEPELLVLDEPAAGVDCRGELLFCELLEELRHTHRFTQLMVTHDLATVAHHATYVVCLNRVVVAEGSPAQVLTDANLAAVFGLHMGLTDRRTLARGAGTGPAPCRCQGGHDHA